MPAVVSKIEFVKQAGRLRITAELPKSFYSALGKKAHLPFKKLAAGFVGEHFAHTVDQIEVALDPGGRGFGGFRRGGARRIKFQYVNGANGIVKTPNWPALSKKYRDKPPVSKRFWNKRDIMSGKFYAGVSSRVRFGTALPTRVTHLEPGTKTGRFRFSINLPTLPAPFDKIIGRSFVEGVPAENVWVNKAGSQHDDLVRLGFPELARPFMGRMAAQLGRRLITDLQKRF